MLQNAYFWHRLFNSVPNIAKSLLSDDVKTITLTLREGMKWSDGRSLTADDVEFFGKSILANKEVTPSPDKIGKQVENLLNLFV